MIERREPDDLRDQKTCPCCDGPNAEPCPFKQYKPLVTAIKGARIAVFCCQEICWALSQDSTELLGVPQSGAGAWHWSSGFGLVDIAEIAGVLHDVMKYGEAMTVKSRLRLKEGTDQWVFYFAEPIKCTVTDSYAVLIHATPLTGEFGDPVQSA